MKVIPTILTTNKQEFEQQIRLFPKYFSRIQLDIADGKLVSNTTTQIEEMIEVLAHNLQLITNNHLFDFHLMVQDYNKEIKKIVQFNQYARVGTVLINFSLAPNLKKLSEKFPHFSFGLDINPDVTISQITAKYPINLINNIQLMSVYPGFQGSPFVPNVLNKIEQIRKLHYKDKIFMDGGINDKTLPIILSKKFRPDFLCIGSYLTKARDKFSDRFSHLQSMIAE